MRRAFREPLLGFLIAVGILCCMGAATNILVDQIIGSTAGLPHIGLSTRVAGTLRCYAVIVQTYANAGELAIPTCTGADPTLTTAGDMVFRTDTNYLFLRSASATNSIYMTPP